VSNCMLICTVGTVKHSKNISRYDSVLLNRLRIGHSRLTHSYLLSGDDPQPVNLAEFHSQ